MNQSILTPFYHQWWMRYNDSLRMEYNATMHILRRCLRWECILLSVQMIHQQLRSSYQWRNLQQNIAVDSAVSQKSCTATVLSFRYILIWIIGQHCRGSPTYYCPPWPPMDGGEGEFHNQSYDLFHMPLRDHASHMFDAYRSHKHPDISIDTGVTSINTHAPNITSSRILSIGRNALVLPRCQRTKTCSKYF